jgi:hypothetical protein
MIKDLTYIILLGFLSYLADISTAPKNYYKKCINKVNFNVKLLFHHIIIMFIFFGWLSNNKYLLVLYAFIPFILIIHWKINNNRCVMTEDINSMCGLDKDEYVRDFLYLIGFKKSKYYDPFYKTFLLFTFVYVIYKLYKM